MKNKNPKAQKKPITQPQSKEIDREKSSTKRFHILSISLILLVSIAIYSNTLKNGFVYDDETTIVNNTLIKDFGNLSKLFTKEYFTASAEMSYRPVVTFTYFIDYAIYGIKPWGYHLTNVLLHALNGVILYIFLTFPVLKHSGTRFIQSSQSSIFNFLSPPLLISLVFVTHPVLTEAVNAISFREDLLCFLFFISSAILYIAHRSSLIAHCSKFKAFSFQLLSLSFYLLALLSKEMAITLPLIIYLYEWIYGKQPPQSPFDKGELKGVVPILLNKGDQGVVSKGDRGLSQSPLIKGVRGLLFNPYTIGYIAVTIFYLFIRFYLFHNPYEEVIQIWTLSESLITIPYLISRYLILLIAPISLSADYVITPLKSLLSIEAIVSIIVVISIFIIALKVEKRNKDISFGILFFLVTLIPVYNIIPIANPFAERYLYLPVTGFTIVIGSVLHLIFNSSWLLSHRSSLIAHYSSY